MRKKKILFFLPLPPPVHGAALRNKSLVESKTINDHFDIEVLPFNFAEEIIDLGKVSLLKIGKFFARAFQLTQKLIQFKPHLVYFNISLFGVSLYRDFLYVVLFKTFHANLLYHLRTQGIEVQSQKSRVKTEMFRYIFRNTHLICLSDYLAKDVQRVYSGKPFIVNNGIEDVTPLYPKKDRGRADTPSILFISNLSKSKGVLDLIAAFAQLKENGSEFKGWIVGNAHDLSLKEVQDIINEKGLQDEVLLLGPKYGDDKFKLFREADIFVLPTYFEAFPGTILEAMQFELPVVATREGAIPEIVTDYETGFLVEKRNINELFKRMNILLHDPKLRKTFGENGRRKFLNSYTVSIYEKNMKETIQTVLKLNGT
jgi:glycosyltransferase involved in cell wall biosynthesis